LRQRAGRRLLQSSFARTDSRRRLSLHEDSKGGPTWDFESCLYRRGEADWPYTRRWAVLAGARSLASLGKARGFGMTDNFEESGLLCFAFQGALQGLIQSSFSLFVLLLRDLALLVFDFEFEEFVFQSLQKHRG